MKKLRCVVFESHLSFLELTNCIFGRYEGGREEKIRRRVRRDEEKAQGSQTCKLSLLKYGYMYVANNI